MNNVLPSPKINAFTFFITSKCTLRCKKCVASIPYASNSYHVPKHQIFQEIRKTADLFSIMLKQTNAEKCETLHADLIGGEALLHPDLVEITQELCKYAYIFNEFRIVTNGTLIPKNDFFDLVCDINKSGVKFSFIVDNYGKVSSKFDKLINILNVREIPYRINDYVGENTHYNGWVDVGNYDEPIHSYNDAKQLFNNGCIHKTFICLPVWNGRIYPCPYMLGGELRETLKVPKGEFLDLFNDNESIEKKVDWLSLHWVINDEPLCGCFYCNGFGLPNQERFPAAEQL